ncbi:MAG: nitroreductase family protein [Thermoplasmata archaeon]|nr:nitroreductase family protein [Thermoplasmata archaeon]
MLKEIEIRRSARAFSSKPIEEYKIKEILEAGRWAPSCFNNQPWNFIVLKDKETEKVHDALNKGNYWAKNAYLIIAIAAKKDSDCISNEREYYLFDSGLAVENILLESYHQGLVAHSILGFNEEIVKRNLSIPDDLRVIVLVIIGYEENLENVDSFTREKELFPRVRKNMNEIVHWGGW